MRRKCGEPSAYPRTFLGKAVLSRLLTRKEQLVLTGVALAILVGAAALYFCEGTATSEPVAATDSLAGEGLGSEQQPAERVTFLPESKAAVPSLNETVLSRAGEDGPAPPANRQPLPAKEEVVVSVQGAVLRPGVYEFDSGERVQDLVDKAGGLRETADVSDINLAATLVDGTTLTIPEKRSSRTGDGPIVIGRQNIPAAQNPSCYTVSGWRPAIGGASSQGNVPQSPAGSTLIGAPGNGKLDLNLATAEQLESLPGIGPKLAAEIIQYRAQSPFRLVDDVTNVSGIGPKRLEAIRPFVCVNPVR